MALDNMYGAETWIFDLDNTLYPAACGLFRQVERNMTRFIMDRLTLAYEDAYAIQKTYFREHGTTMRGLMHHHAVDPADFLSYVHNIDLSPIPSNPDLDGLLSRLPGRKIIFTNGSTGHADNITRYMGIDHHFDAVFDIVAADYVPKPELIVYEQLIESHAIDPSTTVMVEDMAKNLAPAAAIGMTTVWIETDTTWGREHAECDFVHHRASDINAFLSDVVGP
ncbi:MAG: pyrimidine 5'-nucleotidase [Rhodospirillales bacterium]